MTNRERFLKTMNFEPVDHPPLLLDGPWHETRQRWEAEGLPKDVSLNEYFDVEPFSMFNVGPETRMYPVFDEKIIEETEEYIIKVNSKGVTVKMLRTASDSGAAHYLDYAIKGRDDISWLAERFDPDNPERMKNGWEKRLEESLDSTTAVRLVDFGSFYGDLHEHMGTEAVSFIFLDQPDFVHWYNDRIASCCERAIDAACSTGKVDLMGGHEDMAFKNGPLVSPAMFRDFLSPYYRRTVGKAREHGQTVFLQDSDGDIRLLIPLWLEVGVNAFLPLEVASNMDVCELRKEYGRHIALLRGNLDKRNFADSKEAIKEEVMRKVPTVAAEGGFIPGVDHGVPPDVPFENYCYYVQLMKGIYGMS